LHEDAQLNLTGKVALLTGVKRIGGVVAEALAQAGADIALVYNRSAEEADATAAAVRAAGRRALTIQADLAGADDARRAVATAIDQLGRVDVLVAMASLYRATPFAELTVDAWDTQLDVEVRSAFVCAQACAASMRANGGGRIILFSDWLPASERPRYPGFLTYYVAKGALKALTEALALELARDRILVNAIAPGPILAPPEFTEQEHGAVVEATPVGRWGGEEEVAKAVMFLVSTEFVTGETIRVDGGRHLK
jgi:NAD(P)-dependent dehydrogenase (short-subunit alcohol dehydrogenase family)